jgi:g-D-glutamyl-meso-diaminopimelate peptidase
VIYWQFNGIVVPGARELGLELARVSGYELADTPEESAYAGYKDWFIQEFRRPGYTVEAGEGVNPLPLSQFDEIYLRCRGILVTAAMGLPQGSPAREEMLSPPNEPTQPE